MPRFDALATHDALLRRLTDFTLDRAYVTDPELQAAARQIWSGPAAQGGLLSDLWVEGAFPAESSTESTESLAGRGAFDPWLTRQLDTTGAVPANRLLYTHQAEAIAAARDPGCRGIVVTAPTGAGKTEAFLLPMLDTLRRVARAGRAGVRALVLYPLNALVNDQVARMDAWLTGQTDLTLFHFTGETPEDHREAKEDGLPPYEGDHAFRFRTRQQARGFEDARGRRIEAGDGPSPDIVVTNYSMLEYMLCRPQDGVFFGEGRGVSALDVIVLDEAHLYRGTLAAEITLLLRRVFRRAGRNPEDVLVLATSATLGDGKPETLARFLARLSTRPESTIRALVGKPAEPMLGRRPPSLPVDVAALAAITETPETLAESWVAQTPEVTLRVDPDGVERLRASLSPWLTEAPTESQVPARWLHDALPQLEVFHRLVDALWLAPRQPIDSLADQVFGDAGSADHRRAATRLLLDLGAAARTSPEAFPRLPHRLHLLGRTSSGLSVCLSGACTGAPRWRDLGAIQDGSGRSKCAFCGSCVLPVRRCGECGTPALHGLMSADGVLMTTPISAPGPVRVDPQSTVDQPTTQLLSPNSATSREVVYVRAEDGEIVGPGEGTALRVLSAVCPGCGDDADWWNLTTPDTQATSVLAETLLSRTPPIRSGIRNALPDEGRRLLVFSDSRQGAARLGPRLAQQHMRNLTRSLVARAMGGASAAEIGPRIAALRAQMADATDAEFDAIASQIKQLRASAIGLTPAEIEDRVFTTSPLASIARHLSGWDAERKDNADALVGRSLGLSEMMARHLAQSRADFGELLLEEIARPSSRFASVERLGLVEVVYPGVDALTAPDELVGALPGAIREGISQLWSKLLIVLLDGARSDGFVTSGNAVVDHSFTFGSRPLGTYCALDREASGIKAWRPPSAKSSRRFVLATGVLKALGATDRVDEAARAILDAAWTQLAQSNLATIERNDTLQVDGQLLPAWRVNLGHIRLRAPQALHQSSSRGLVWANAVLGFAHGTVDLRPVTREQLRSHPRVGRALSELGDGEQLYQHGIWAEEHTAQLATPEAHRIQNLFRIGARNVLSATTTMELGVDIGGLQAVMLSNVAPARANYIQRAGRAGRRADGSSMVLTHARARPFDREVFGRFGDYLGRMLPAPEILLDRERIARRHLHAWLLASYFLIERRAKRAGAMTAFANLGHLLGVEPPQSYSEGMLNRPAWTIRDNGIANAFIAWLRDVAIGRAAGAATMASDLVFLAHGTGAALSLDEVAGFLERVAVDFKAVTDRLMASVEALANDWNALPEAPDTTLWSTRRLRFVCGALRHQAVVLLRTPVIAALGDQQFLPRYGFPIGVHRLRVYDEKAAAEDRRRAKESDTITLDRGALVAVREYAPGRTLMVGGRAVESRGIQLGRARQSDELGLITTIFQCRYGHIHYMTGRSGDSRTCDECRRNGDDGQLMRPSTALEPENGFSTAVSRPPARTFEVQEAWAYSLMTTAVHMAATDPLLPGVVARLSIGGELLAVSGGEFDEGYAICTRCGYSDSETSKPGASGGQLPSGFQTHFELWSTNRCWPGTQQHVLRHHRLSARETTDLLVLDGSGLMTLTTDKPARDRAEQGERILRTLGRALALAGARRLEVDSREIGLFGVATGARGAELCVVVYDAVPGGAGHMEALLSPAHRTAWLDDAETLLRGSVEHDLHCDTACLDCILTFDAQDDVASARLARRETLQWLESVRGSRPAMTFTDLEQLAAPTLWEQVTTGGETEFGAPASITTRFLRTALRDRPPVDSPSATAGWSALLKSAAAGLRAERLAQPDVEKLEIARDIVRRHLGEHAPLSWVRPDSVVGLDPEERAMLYAHLTQAAADAESDDAISRAAARAEKYLLDSPDLARDARLRVLGAVGRAYGVLAPTEGVGRALEVLSEAVDGWEGASGASFPLCEALRLSGADGRLDAVAEYDGLARDWLARHEASDPFGAGFVRVALGRAWFEAGNATAALDTLGASAPSRSANHVVATWRRVRAAALTHLGDRDGAEQERTRLSAEGPELWSHLAVLDLAIMNKDAAVAAKAARTMLHAEFGFEAARLLIRLAPVATEHERFHDLELLGRFARWFRY